jgi:hypothetical protein
MPAILFALLVHTYVQATPAPEVKIYQPSASQTNILSVHRDFMRLFISGHSLMEQPIPDQLEAIAKSLGTPLEWNRQSIGGSSILTRSRGNNPRNATWSGYQNGFNRSGQGLNIVSELRNPKTVSKGHYDALLITEQHGLLDSLTWNDTVRYLRHYHDLLIDGSPQAKTYFYEPWLGLNDKGTPYRWIAYERAASPIWQCIATRINMSLKIEGRSDRIFSLPAGAALAELIDRATRPGGLSGITLGNVHKTVTSLIKDDVHLTELGSYYVALVSYSITYGRSTYGAWRPASVSITQANALQQTASDFVTRYSAVNTPLTLEECKKELRTSFIGMYWSYVRDVEWPSERNVISAYIRWVRYVLKWHWRIRVNSTHNPFHFDPKSDHTFWLPKP